MRLFWIIIFFLLPFNNYATMLFVNSTPIGADVYVQQGKKNNIVSKKLGVTPMKFEAVSNLTLVVHKKNHVPVTNSIKISQKSVQNYEAVLEPLSFVLSLPQESGALYVNKKFYSALDGDLVLPYGNYNINFNRRTQALGVSYKSPYTPLVGFFTTTTILSLGAVILGSVMGAQCYNRFYHANTAEEALESLGKTASWDSVTWTGIGVGSASVIGLGIFGALEAKERKRIKRFNGMNRKYDISNDLKEFSQIVEAYASDPMVMESQLTRFIQVYTKEDSRFVPKVYLKRANLYVLQKNNKKALDDLSKLIKDFPTFETCETAQKLIGDIYFKNKEFEKAYQAYRTSEQFEYNYAYEDIHMKTLESLYESFLINKKYKDILLTEMNQTLKNRKISKENREKVLIWQKKVENK
ncbi:hypothetical protein SAMN02745150_00077 [Brevinema andersonii]|uniref:Uncharacterized protein n=1 Tax=Brevinema andersonii TaxID=34097 RepID=A0A1I1CYF7_BREAD|nr:tetratricopeptide repeat protein [Brevinema andersonii]SFB67554.1 hypothetical protein SAMN02745150_00077 [Brevinema andersonii]